MTSSLLTPTRGLKAQGTEDTLVRLYSELGFAEQAKCCPIVAVPVDEDDVENWLLFFESLPSRSLRKLKITSNIKLPAETGKARHWKDMSAASRYHSGAAHERIGVVGCMLDARGLAGGDGEFLTTFALVGIPLNTVLKIVRKAEDAVGAPAVMIPKERVLRIEDGLVWMNVPIPSTVLNGEGLFDNIGILHEAVDHDLRRTLVPSGRPVTPEMLRSRPSSRWRCVLLLTLAVSICVDDDISFEDAQGKVWDLHLGLVGCHTIADESGR